MSSNLDLETDGQGPGQKLLFEQHEHFPDTSRFRSLSSGDTRRQNIIVTIPRPSQDGRPSQKELVLNDVVELPLKYALESSTASGAQDGLLAMASQSTRAKVSPLQIRKRSGSSKITFSGQILPTWLYQEWSISASSSGCGVVGWCEGAG